MEWLAAEPVLADYAFVAGQSATTGVGLYELNELRHWAIDKGTSMVSRLRSGRTRAPVVITPSRKRDIDTVYRTPPTYAPRTLAPRPIMTRATIKRGRGGRYHRNLGRKPGSYKTRRNTQEGFKRDLQDKTFSSTRLIQIPWSEDEAIINTRRGQLTNVRGLHFNAWFKQPFDLATGAIVKYQAPIQVRWAIINPKENTGAISLGTSNFFVSKNPVSDMSDDFPGSGKCFDFMNRKINRELYSVMSQGMFVLQPPIDTGTATSYNTSATGGADETAVQNRQRLGPGSFKKVSVNIPIKKQMRWDSNQAGVAGQYPDQNIYFCWWYCQMGDDSTEKRYTVSRTPVRVDYEVTNYFTNSKMFS